jgi:hypothetical protein
MWKEGAQQSGAPAASPSHIVARGVADFGPGRKVTLDAPAGRRDHLLTA